VISMCFFRLGCDLDVVSCDVLIVRCFETKIVVKFMDSCFGRFSDV